MAIISRYAGIDLGTTNSCSHVAWKTTNGIRVQDVKAEQTDYFGVTCRQYTLLPSCVAFDPNTPFPIVGRVARDYSARAPVVENIKLEMGKNKEFSFNGISYRADDISALILKPIVDSLREIDGGAPLERDVIVTIPASFNMAQRWATRQAGIRAGLHKDRVKLLEEPKAALIDFAYTWMIEPDVLVDLDCQEFLQQDKLVMVYDFGGGTLDVSLHLICLKGDSPENLMIEDLAVGRYTELGGSHIDLIIRDNIIGRFRSIESAGNVAELRDDSVEIRRYLRMAEAIKMDISRQYRKERNNLGRRPDDVMVNYSGSQVGENFSTFNLPILKSEVDRWIGQFISRGDLSLEKLRDMVNGGSKEPFLPRNSFLGPVVDLLRKFYTTPSFYQRHAQRIQPWQKPDFILLNGGMSYYPTVEEELEGFFGSDMLFIKWTERDLAVSRGAAIYNVILSGGKLAKSVVSESYYFKYADADGVLKNYPFIEAGAPFDLIKCLEGQIPPLQELDGPAKRLLIPIGVNQVNIGVFKENWDGEKEYLFNHIWKVTKLQTGSKAEVRWQLDHDKIVEMEGRVEGEGQWMTFIAKTIDGDLPETEIHSVSIQDPREWYSEQPEEYSIPLNAIPLDIKQELSTWRNNFKHVYYGENLVRLMKECATVIEPKLLKAANWTSLIPALIDEIRNNLITIKNLSSQRDIKKRWVNFHALSRLIIVLYKLCTRLRPFDELRIKAASILISQVLKEDTWRQEILNDRHYTNLACKTAAIGLGMISDCKPNRHGILLRTLTASICEGELLKVMESVYVTRALQFDLITALGKSGRSDFLRFAYRSFPEPYARIRREGDGDVEYQPSWGNNMVWAIGRAASRRAAEPVGIDNPLAELIEAMVWQLVNKPTSTTRQETLLFALGQVLDCCVDIPEEYRAPDGLRDRTLKTVKEKICQRTSLNTNILNGMIGRLEGRARTLEGIKPEFRSSEAAFLRMVIVEQ